MNLGVLFLVLLADSSGDLLEFAKGRTAALEKLRGEQFQGVSFLEARRTFFGFYEPPVIQMLPGWLMSRGDEISRLSLLEFCELGALEEDERTKKGFPTPVGLWKDIKWRTIALKQMARKAVSFEEWETVYLFARLRDDWKEFQKTALLKMSSSAKSERDHLLVRSFKRSSKQKQTIAQSCRERD